MLDPVLQSQVHEVLEVQLADTVKARRFLPDGSTERVRPGGRERIRAQERLYELIAARTRLGAGES